MTQIPLLNLPALYERHREELNAAIQSICETAAFVGGENVNAFAREFAQWVGVDRKSVGCANGTDAIALAAMALQLPKGSEAILPAMTYFATLEGILHAGFSVRLVDVQPGTWVMDPKLLSKAIGPNTRLIVPVHLYGQMAPMDEFREIADRHHCKILEDAAQAHGSLWKAQGVGHWGDIASFSFYPGKNLGAFGDAGAVLSRHEDLLERVQVLGNHGGLKRYEHQTIGFNSRLDGIQAAVLRVKLKYLEQWNQNRIRVAQMYLEELSSVRHMSVHTASPYAKHTYHLFVVLVEERASFMSFLKSEGIETGIHYPKALHQQEACKRFEFSNSKFPVAEELANHGVSLPMCPTLTDMQVMRVVKAVKDYFGTKRRKTKTAMGITLQA